MSITGANYERVMALDAQGLTNAEIAAKTGVSSRTISRMRNGQWEPPRGPSMPLTGVIQEHMDAGYSLDELTVLARDNDPFRQDRAEGHKLGRWLRDTLEAMGFEVGEGGRTIHNRGLHYLLLGSVKPDGSVYQNTEYEWKWLNDRVGKAAPAARARPVHPDHRPAQRRAGSSRWRPSGTARWRKGTAGDGPHHGM